MRTLRICACYTLHSYQTESGALSEAHRNTQDNFLATPSVRTLMRKGEYRVSSVEICFFILILSSYPTRRIDNISTVYMHMLRITGF